MSYNEVFERQNHHETSSKARFFENDRMTSIFILQITIRKTLTDIHLPHLQAN